VKHERLPLAYNPLSRRMLLKGAAGALAVPFLSSLDARAQASPDTYFIFSQMTHGRHELAWYPQGVTLPSATTGVGALPLASVSGPLGNTLGTDFDDLRGKINLLQGIDYPSASNNHDMWPFTGSGRIGGSGGAAGESPNYHYSVDTVLSESKNVYPVPAPIPVLRLNPRVGGQSFSFLGTGPDGFGNRAPALGRTLTDTWNAVTRFIKTDTAGQPQDSTPLKRKFLIDQSLAEFKTVAGSPQLSSADKIALQNYADQLQELQRRLSTQAAPTTANCTAAPNVQETSDNDAFNERLIDIMTLAMACGVTRIATYALNWESCVTSSGQVGYDLFHDTVHAAHQGGFQQTVTWWNHALKKWAYMVRRLDQLGLLAKSAVVFTSDFSSSTDGHYGADMPVLTAGTLGGKLRTGEWIDFRNPAKPLRETGGLVMNASGQLVQTTVKRFGGRRINELWISLFTAAGLTPADYQRMGRTGFGEYDCMDTAADRCSASMVASLVNYYRTSYTESPTATLPYLLT
jgi:hypothetical protein